jgi:ABC-2 type transport system permease protein
MISLVISIAFSIIICSLFVSFGKAFVDYDTHNISVGLLDNDKSSISLDFKRYLNKELSIDTVENMSYDNLANKLIEREISAIIEIPKDFQENGINKGKLPNVIFTTLDDYENIAFIKSYIDIYSNSVNSIVEAAENDKSQFDKMFAGYQSEGMKIEKGEAYIPNREKDLAQAGLSITAGFFTFMMMVMSYCIALVVMDDKQSGVFNRIQISPVKSAQYIIGTTLFAVFTSLFIVATFCVFLVVRNYQIGIPIGYLALIMSLFAIVILGLALIVALFCKSKNAMMTIIITFGVIGPVIGGAYFPLDLAPQTLQNLAKVTPHYWMMQGIKDLVINPNQSGMSNIIILSLFAVLSYLIAAAKFVQKESSKE